MGTFLVLNNADFSKNAVNKLPLVNSAISITNGGLGWQLISGSTTRLSNDASYGGIFIPNGESILIFGLKGINPSVPTLRFDVVYYSNAIIPTTLLSGSQITSRAQGAVGSASNFVSANYFPFNSTGELDQVIVTNSYGGDYYFALAIAATNKSDDILASNYNLTWRRI